MQLFRLSLPQIMSAESALGARSIAAGNRKAKKKGVSVSKKAGLQFPVGRIRRYLKRGKYANRVGLGAGVYLAAVLEYLSAEILELSGNVARDAKRQRIQPRHMKLAIANDEDLAALLKHALWPKSGVQPHIHKVLLPKKKEKKPKADAEEGEEKDDAAVSGGSAATGGKIKATGKGKGKGKAAKAAAKLAEDVGVT